MYMYWRDELEANIAWDDVTVLTTWMFDSADHNYGCTCTCIYMYMYMYSACTCICICVIEK